MQCVAKPKGKARQCLLKAMGSLETADATMALQVIGTTHGIEVTAQMVSSMLDTCAEWDVASVTDFTEALSETCDPEELQRLTDARDLAKSLGWLPETRDIKIDGWRVSHVDGPTFMVDGETQGGWWDSGRDCFPWEHELDTGEFEVSQDDLGTWYEEIGGRSY